MVNMGRIHRELRKFLMISLNLIKSDNELVIEIRENGRFGKITQRRIHRIKNHSIWISIYEEIKSTKWGEIFKNRKNEKPKLKTKLN